MSFSFADSLRAGTVPILLASYQQTCMTYIIPDDGQRNCPKYVEFYSQNKLEKLVRLVDFIVRKYIPISLVARSDFPRKFRNSASIKSRPYSLQLMLPST